MSEKVQYDSVHLAVRIKLKEKTQGRIQEQDQLSWLLTWLKIQKSDHSFIKTNGPQTGVGKRLPVVSAGPVRVLN